ncbi:NlpC/P60 family protein [Peptostreptococcaceae bacterium AS15]|nr:NlpC/P60 family protein [Peptostreptococcaceae bacterium AS15]
MRKKLKKDFMERQKIKEEAGILAKENIDIEESTKLKYGDDYRGKIVHDKDRFQDKIYDKSNKRNCDTKPVQHTSKKNRRHIRKIDTKYNISKVQDTTNTTNDSLLSRKSNKELNSIVLMSKSIGENKEHGLDKEKVDLQKKRKIAEKIRKEVRTEERYSQNEEIYDPLGKDMDNDGIIDRYDNDFRNSDYFESSYDVDGLNKQEITGGDISEHKAQKKLYKRKNHVESLYTRKKDDISNADKQKEEFESSVNSKKAIYKNKNKLSKGEKQSLKSSAIKVSALSGLAKGSELVRDYLSNGSDENQGVEAAEKIADGNSKLLHGIKNYSNIKKVKKNYNLSKKDYKIRKRKSKLEFREGKEELKKTDEYKKAHAFKKFQKRKQMKNTIRKQNKSRLRDRIKEEVVNVLKSLKETIIQKIKGLMIIVIGLIILGIFFINFAGTSMTGMINSASGVLATSYLSDKNVLSEVNQQFENLEEGLQDELENIEEYHPGYDEYNIEKEGQIGHNTHELLSYITSRYGAVKDSNEVNSIVNELFAKMYELSYREKVEIRYRTVTETYIDDKGNRQTYTYEEPYEYKKLIVTLKKREMDTVIREIFSDYPDNVIHYEALLATKGNMGDVFGSGNGDLSEIVNNPDFSNPGIAFDDSTVKALFNEAEKHIGKKYVFGANGPSNFDCSSFVCWSFTHSGVKNMPRTTAWGIYKDYCSPVSPSEAKAGDIIFFKNTYNSGSPISHVGIYAGNGMMIHAGNPIRFVSINTAYWKEHFYAFGRVN